MKSYKLVRWLLRGSALTAVMFVMQACYGSPMMPPEVPDNMETTNDASEAEVPVSDTLVQTDMQSAE